MGNVFTRNVACGSPTPAIAVWYVPQQTQNFRTSSSVCIGNADLDLPAIASAGTATDKLNANGLTGRDYASLTSPSANPNKNCYYPSDFDYNTYNGDCLEYTTDQNGTPYGAQFDNVAYGMAGYHSEFPEVISTDWSLPAAFAPLKYTWCDSSSSADCQKINPTCQEFVDFNDGTPMCLSYLPARAWNSCTGKHNRTNQLNVTNNVMKSKKKNFAGLKLPKT